MKNVTHNGSLVTLPDTEAYICNALKNGVDYKVIASVSNMSVSALRTRKCRMNAQKMHIADTLHPVTPAIENVTTDVTQPETVANLTPEPENITEGFLPNLVKTFHPADLIYYACVAVACLGIVHAIPRVGVAVAGIYFSVALVAMVGIKTKTGWARLPHFLALAFVELVGFAGHTIWANAALWGNVKALPLAIYVEKYQNGAGETIAFYAGADADKPFYMSVAVAGIMFACAVYVCAISIQDKK